MSEPPIHEPPVPTPPGNGPASPIEQSPRNITGWIVFGLLILLSIAANFVPEAKTTARLKPHDSDQELLRHAMSAVVLETMLRRPIASHESRERTELDKTLAKPIAKLVLQSDRDPMAAMLYAEMRTFQGLPVPAARLRLLKVSKYPEDRAFFGIYSAQSLSRQQAATLCDKLPSNPFVYQAARAQAFERAGDGAALDRYVSPVPAFGEAFLSICFWPFLFCSLVIWLGFRKKAQTKTLFPRGIPLASITPVDADRLAIRAGQIFCVFIAASLLAAAIVSTLRGPHLGGALTAAAGLVTIAAVFGLQYMPVLGKQIRLADMGLSTANLWSDVRLGVLGFVAEFPVALMLSVVCVTLLRFLPAPTHPATEALEHSHDWRTVVPILILGCIVAPFWEEVAFRGLIFPGLNRLLGGMVSAILVSSFLFACVHPQGITIWLPLAFVGVTSCYLQYQSKSLIPGMVMHCLHNGAIFAAILLT